jgi:hypothetical protein
MEVKKKIKVLFGVRIYIPRGKDASRLYPLWTLTWLAETRTQHKEKYCNKV